MQDQFESLKRKIHFIPLFCLFMNKNFTREFHNVLKLYHLFWSKIGKSNSLLTVTTGTNAGIKYLHNCIFQI